MRSNFIRNSALAGLTVLLAVACQTKPKVTEGDATASGSGADTESPVIENRDGVLDAAGSDGGKINGLSTIFFEYDQARLTGEARKTLAQNADWIKKNAGLTVQVEGHTDERGSNEYNLSLGERRAKSVKAYLESLGVDARRMSIISYGEEKPLQPGDSESAWSKNRRANFVPLQ